jgi:DNA-binding NarL/FixJ family response regulator
MQETAPVRVALTNDFEVVVAGLRQMLAPFDRIRVVDTAVDGDGVDRRVDVALFDTFGHPTRGLDEIERLVHDRRVARVAVYTWQFDAALVDRALAAGVSGYLSKALDAETLALAIQRVAAGHRVVSDDPVLDRHTDPSRAWPGRDLRLSERESEVLVLIAEGLSNLEIAGSLAISPNSVKTHVRHAYRKLGVSTRAQAVRAVVDHRMVRPRR